MALGAFSLIPANSCAGRLPIPGWPALLSLVVLTIVTSGATAQWKARTNSTRDHLSASDPAQISTAQNGRRLPTVSSLGRNRPPHPAVVRVRADDKGGTSFGSGTLVDIQSDYALVVTNWHVVRDATQNVTVTFPNGFQTAARVIRMDKNWDLAALVVWNPGNVKPVQIAGNAPHPGDALTIAGYGSGHYRAATGRCTQYVAPGANFPYEMVEVSVEARHGDSGGPIFNDQGELAGVLFGASRGTTSGSYAGRVQQFLLTAWPDLGVPRDTMIAAAPRKEHNRSSGYVASIDGGPGHRKQPVPSSSARPNRRNEKSPGVTVPQQQQIAPRDGATVAARPPAEPARITLDPGSKQEIAWEDIVGHSPFQQAKTLFALIGVVVTMLHLVSFSSDGK